jgi:uncharacterized membrane protein YjjB (DUF3815 family)
MPTYTWWDVFICPLATPNLLYVTENKPESLNCCGIGCAKCTLTILYRVSVTKIRPQTARELN